ncbi:MAG TPA: oxidoreductase C-terminal domain-containing protein, partial [Acidimicrobiales bacterium]|nr:oxidoreductase C-terminal domain-containing protein [Acidimicrobiales bacterium]
MELAESAGLSRSDGVDTDEFLATDGPGIFAAGDVAGAWHPVLKRRIRLEHWSSALNQGPLAARNMLGRATPYEKLPYFFSDQYDVGLEYTGLATDWDRVVYRGKPDEREFIAFWLKDDRVKAGMNVNVWDVADDIGALVRSGSPVTVDRLTDPEVPLGEVLDG